LNSAIGSAMSISFESELSLLIARSRRSYDRSGPRD
jgi:hypothetical protein